MSIHKIFLEIETSESIIPIIKLPSRIVKDENSIIVYENIPQSFSYNTFIDPKFAVNNLPYKDSINYSVGRNLITKPYWVL